MRTLILKNHKPPSLEFKSVTANHDQRSNQKKENFLFLLSQDDYLYIYRRRNQINAVQAIHNRMEQLSNWSDDLILSSCFFLWKNCHEIVFYGDFLYIASDIGLHRFKYNDFVPEQVIYYKTIIKIQVVQYTLFITEKNANQFILYKFDPNDDKLIFLHKSIKNIFIQYDSNADEFVFLSDVCQCQRYQWEWTEGEVTSFHIFLDDIPFYESNENNKIKNHKSEKHFELNGDDKSDFRPKNITNWNTASIKNNNLEKNDSNSHIIIGEKKNTNRKFFSLVGSATTVNGNFFIFKLDDGTIIQKIKVCDEKITSSVIMSRRYKFFFVLACQDGRMYWIGVDDSNQVNHVDPKQIRYKFIRKLFIHHKAPLLYKIDTKHIISISNLIYSLYFRKPLYNNNSKSPIQENNEIKKQDINFDWHFKYYEFNLCIKKSDSILVIREDKNLNFYSIHNKENDEKLNSIEYLMKYNTKEKMIDFHLHNNFFTYQIRNKIYLYSFHYQSKINIMKVKEFEGISHFITDDLLIIFKYKQKKNIIFMYNLISGNIEESEQDMCVFDLLSIQQQKIKKVESIFRIVNRRYDTLICKEENEKVILLHKMYAMKIIKGIQIDNFYIFMGKETLFKLKETEKGSVELQNINLGKYLIDLVFFKNYLIILQYEREESFDGKWGNK